MAGNLKKGIGSKYQLPILAAYIGTAGVLSVHNTNMLDALLQHGAAAGVVGVFLLVLQEVFPPVFKEALVFWRIKDRLPGCRAFSVLAPRETRLDQAKLATLLPEQAMSASEQNALWYRWLKQFDEDVVIAESHRRYLALRESAVLLASLTVFSPLLGFIPPHNWPRSLLLCGIIGLAYVVTAYAARNAGDRFVCNVIALKVAKT